MPRPRPRRGTLLFPIVYLASLSLIGSSTVALAVLGRDQVTRAAIEIAVGADERVVLDHVRETFSSGEFAAGDFSDARRAVIAASLRDLVRTYGYADAAIVSAAGETIGIDPTGGWPELAAALREVRTSASIQVVDDQDGSALLVETIPVVGESGIAFVYGLRRDATAILARADETWRYVVIVTSTAGVALMVVLFAIFRAANARLRRQEERLVEARRRDPLTGLLNHGAGFAMLSQLIETNRESGRSVGIAIVDLDNFRLLNGVHGSELGDEALLVVKRALVSEADDWVALARCGPDEFLAIALDGSARDMPHALARVAERLRSTWLHPPGAERLPVTVSVGIAYFPFHAASVTELMSAATIALGEAKSGGGDRIEIAEAWTEQPRRPDSTFDVLQGLVLAVDRKDRYTKFHSEDVAAYSLFLAERMGRSDELRGPLGTAAILHDIGKIGVPDDILRKPGRLTPYEQEVMKQHVALGDLIVRDLPDLDQIRAGVRFHHERWDGRGYLAGLAGLDIPLVARILAVADAFSAMTTTRPYRKALAVDDALGELEAVAGTQLDPDLVREFVRGMRVDPAAPMPGEPRALGSLWSSPSRAA